MSFLKKRKRENIPECGRRVCSYCKIDIGPAPGLKFGELTHGACPECYTRVMNELDKHDPPQAGRKSGKGRW